MPSMPTPSYTLVSHLELIRESCILRPTSGHCTCVHVHRICIYFSGYCTQQSEARLMEYKLRMPQVYPSRVFKNQVVRETRPAV